MFIVPVAIPADVTLPAGYEPRADENALRSVEYLYPYCCDACRGEGVLRSDPGNAAHRACRRCRTTGIEPRWLPEISANWPALGDAIARLRTYYVDAR